MKLSFKMEDISQSVGNSAALAIFITISAAGYCSVAHAAAKRFQAHH